MARFCTYCGNEVNENAVLCVKCGCAIPDTKASDYKFAQRDSVVDVISQRIKTNGIIWIVIAVIQIILGLCENWLILIVGILNLISSIQDLTYSQSFPKKPVGIVAKEKPLILPIIILIYNLLIGGVIGVAGSIYYLVAVRGYVLENEQAFCEIENQYTSTPDRSCVYK